MQKKNCDYSGSQLFLLPLKALFFNGKAMQQTTKQLKRHYVMPRPNYRTKAYFKNICISK